MEEKNGLDLLIENLVELGMVPNVTVENKGTLFPSNNRFASCTTVIVSISDSIYLVARANISTSFTGIYSSVLLPQEAEYKVYLKNWFDFLIYSNRQKVGIKYIDEHLTIVAPKYIPYKEINLENAQQFVEINKFGKPYTLVMENNYLSFIVDQLKDQKVVGIETNDWLYKKEDLEILLNMGVRLIRNISSQFKN